MLKMELIKVLPSIAILIFCCNKVVCYENYKGKQNALSEDEESDPEIFKPTMEWQEVKKNQKIPKGLHVQLNLQTGVRRAKLLDSSENEDRTALLSVPEQTENEEVQKTEESEKKSSINLDNIGAVDPETFPKVKQKYRSYKEIKEDFKELELGIKTDLELMNELLDLFEQIKDKKYTDDGSKDREEVWLNTLIDLEYLVHQVDNARLFTKGNGIKNVVFPSLNSTLPKIRAQGARLLGAACQNNVPSQIAALESGAIRELLHMFVSDVSPSVQSSALFGLSCIIRNFPVAQKSLIDTGGLGILNSVFDGESSDQLKLQVKVVTLINDLLIERQEVEQTIQAMYNDNSTDTTLLEETKEKQRQYNLVNLSDKLLEHKWCKHLVDILLKQILPIEDSNDFLNKMAHQLNHDNVEKIIEAISISTICEGKFKDNALLKKALLNLIKMYAELSKEELANGDTDGYYTGIHTDISNILSKLR